MMMNSNEEGVQKVSKNLSICVFLFNYIEIDIIPLKGNPESIKARMFLFKYCFFNYKARNIPLKKEVQNARTNI